ncbi:MAG: WG repeat-containing protein, partial [Muribaculaceae bacterium]|nr:WG repeat-containing protein [Muribaculaceae bacterium]
DGVMPVVPKGEHITFVDSNGKIKFTLDKVDGANVDQGLFAFINGRYSFHTENGSWGVIDNHGEVIIKPVYKSPLVFLSDKVLSTNEETGDIVIIDRYGIVKEKVTGLPDDIPGGFGFFIDGMTFLCVNETCEDGESNRQWYKIKENGDKEKLPAFVYDILAWDSDYIVYLDTENNGCGVITVDGESVVRPKYSGIEILANGMLIGARNDKCYRISYDGEAESLGGETYPAIWRPSLSSQIFDFKFELVTEKDGSYILRSSDGERIGKKMKNFSTSLSLDNVYSDYYDYEAVTEKFVSMFDAQGLKGYPFGSQMSVYASRTSYSKEWFRGDRSMNVTIEEANKYFHVSSATIYSNNYIVYDAGGWDYYDWQFNPSATLNAFKLTVSLPDDNHTEGLIEHFAKALENKYGVNIQTGGSGMNTLRKDGYGSITIEVNDYGWSGSVEASAEEVVAEVLCDSVCAE